MQPKIYIIHSTSRFSCNGISCNETLFLDMTVDFMNFRSEKLHMKPIPLEFTTFIYPYQSSWIKSCTK